MHAAAYAAEKEERRNKKQNFEARRPKTRKEREPEKGPKTDPIRKF